MGRGSQTRDGRRVRHLSYLSDKVAEQEVLLEMNREQLACQTRVIKNLEQINQLQREIIAALRLRLE